jgi:hypothetical protein
VNTCESCAAPIVWAITVAGKLIPLDVEPSAGGNLRKTGKNRTTKHGSAPEVEVAPQMSLWDGGDGARYVTHFATCPNAGEHRGKKSPGKKPASEKVARRERDVGMSSVERNAAETWKAAMWDVVVRLAASGEDFTTDDVWFAAERLDIPPVHDGRALGPLMMRASRQNVVEATGYRPSVRRHLTPIRVWRGVKKDALT